MCVCGQLHSRVKLWPHGLYPPDSSVSGIFQARIWSGLSFPTPEDLPLSGIETSSLACPALAGEFFTTVPPGKPLTLYVVAIQSQLFATPWTSTSGFPVPHPLLKFAQVHIHCIGDAIQSSYLLILLLLSVFPSIRDFSNESAVHIRWPKYWNFSFSISPSNEYSGLIFLKTDWFDLGVEGTLSSLLQYHGSKASILWCSAFFMVQQSQPYMITGKTIPLTIWTFVSRAMSLLFNRLSRFVIVFLLKSSHLFSWLQSPSAVILELKKRKSVTTSTFSPSICHEVMEPNAPFFNYLVSSQLFHSLPSPSSRGSLVWFLPLEWYYLHV